MSSSRTPFPSGEARWPRCQGADAAVPRLADLFLHQLAHAAGMVSACTGVCTGTTKSCLRSLGSPRGLAPTARSPRGGRKANTFAPRPTRTSWPHHGLCIALLASWCYRHGHPDTSAALLAIAWRTAKRRGMANFARFLARARVAIGVALARRAARLQQTWALACGVRRKKGTRAFKAVVPDDPLPQDALGIHWRGSQWLRGAVGHWFGHSSMEAFAAMFANAFPAATALGQHPQAMAAWLLPAASPKGSVARNVLGWFSLEQVPARPHLSSEVVDLFFTSKGAPTT